MNTDVTKVKVQSFLEERTYANTERRTVRRWHVSWFDDAGQAHRLTFGSWDAANMQAQIITDAFRTLARYGMQPYNNSEPPC